MVGAFISSKEEKKTELKKMLFSKTLGPRRPRVKWIVASTRRSLVCADYIAFCYPEVWLVYVHTCILHYTGDNILRINDT